MPGGLFLLRRTGGCGFAVVEEGEIFLLQAGEGIAVLVHCGDTDLHRARLALKDGHLGDGGRCPRHQNKQTLWHKAKTSRGESALLIRPTIVTGW
jgi:hypothetical protein